MGRIFLEKQTFSFDEIKASIPMEIPDDFYTAFQFCHEWLNGKNEFTLFTSGSTGTPKAIKLSRSQMEHSAKATGQALHLEKGDKALVCLNTAYIAGTMMLVRGLVLELELWLVAPTSTPLEKFAEDTSIDFAAFVPLQLQQSLQDPKATHKLNQMKAILVGGAQVNGELEEKLQSISSPIYGTYGMTETVSHIALKKLNGNTREDCFTTLPGVVISTDDRNCLRICSAVTNNQWIQTNDIAKILESNRFQWVGRADYTINSGGIKIQPEDLETILTKKLQELGIVMYFIAGLPHPQLGEAVTLFVEGNHDEKKIQEQIKTVVTHRFHNPKAVISLSEFPKTATGKIERATILDRFKDFYSGENK